jgi:hypothetical protein
MVLKFRISDEIECVFEHTESFSEGILRTNEKEIKGRKVKYNELIDINAFKALNGNLGDIDYPVMYHHFYGFRGNDERVLKPSYFGYSHKTETELYESGLNRWRLDLTIYNGKPLPASELNRSKGHVNKMSVEYFQVLSGKVRIYLEQEDRESINGYFCDLNKNEYMLVPPGWYHSTHVIEGPAAVLDIVNREGFVDWKHKGYRDKQAACTFIGVNNKIFPLYNRARKPFKLHELKPLEHPLFDHEHRSLFELMYSSNDRDLIEFSRSTVGIKDYVTFLEKFTIGDKHLR